MRSNPGLRRTNSALPALDLPPPFQLVTLREVGDAFAHAQSVAGTEGAGTLVYVGRFDLAEFAVVLEPDEPLRTARRAFYAGMNALTDALITHAPPEKAIVVEWPGTLRVDGGLVGGSRTPRPIAPRVQKIPVTKERIATTDKRSMSRASEVNSATHIRSFGHHTPICHSVCSCSYHSHTSHHSHPSDCSPAYGDSPARRG